MVLDMLHAQSISGLVVEYIVAIDVTRVRFPADAYMPLLSILPLHDAQDEASTPLLCTLRSSLGLSYLSHSDTLSLTRQIP